MASPRPWLCDPVNCNGPLRTMTRAASRALAWALPGALAGLLAAAPALAGSSTPPAGATAESCPIPPKAAAPLRDFKPIDDLYLEVDKRKVAAELFRSETAGAMLVISPALSVPLVLRAESLFSVDRAAIERQPDGAASVKAGAALKPLGKFEITDDSARFSADGHQAELLPTPPLLGLRQAEEVKAHNPDYVAGAKKYAPDAGAITALKKEQRAVTVRIYYGSWCPHCAMLVPHGLRVEQELGASKIRFEYFGVSRHFAREAEVKKAGVGTIPTAVVYVDGREAGRIIDDASWKSPESALRAILESTRAAGLGR
jgi:thiol-disulfide isomerase/thioredoxin